MFYDNLKQECERQNLKISPIVKECGGAIGSINGWKKGAMPNSDILMKLALRLNVSSDYLLFGKEKSSSADNISDDERELLEKYKMLEEIDRARIKERTETLLEIRNAEKPKPELRRPARKTCKIDLYETPVSAGTGVYLESDYKRKIKIFATPELEKADFALRVTGDSMEPDFSDGDILLVKSTCIIDEGQIGVFIIDGEGYVKIFKRDRLCSLNKTYKDIKIYEYTDGSCRGQVISKIKEDEIIEIQEE